MYAKCGGCDDAKKVFDRCLELDIVSRNDMISGYVRNGRLEGAREVFDGMTERNVVSWSAMIDGYSKVGEMDMARYLFDEMPERNQFPWNSLLSGYVKCGRVEVAREIFDEMPERDVFSWTIMISGYSQSSQFKESLELFLEMLKSRVIPNRITLISVLPAIAQLGALSQGRWIHAYADKKGIEINGVLGAALVDMYCKCGSIDKALALFESLKYRTSSTWNSVILGLAAHGRGTDALCVFSRMQNDSTVTLNEITFVGVLSACCHAGLVNEGLKMFDLFTYYYKLRPNIRHYGCLVDLLGRAGFVNEAKELIDRMPIEPNPVIWKTLLSACRMHKNVELAEHVARVAIESAPQDSGFYALLFNIFAEAGYWNNMANVRREMNDLEVQKTVGCSWVEVDGVIHEFFAGRERFHRSWREICSVLETMDVDYKEKFEMYI
ncbi:hypothetical protein Syun_008171 [Stephania yunnanensis]|uniref:Chlororespiratory reduction 4 n=1 Tax=Stephania yunnanensis TaxID=152371 RepID=A0AAP0PZZ2_9MAGN